MNVKSVLLEFYFNRNSFIQEDEQCSKKCS